ncbi:MAG: septum formation initiator family protein [Clostridia bacterium]|nr:septum formation initiator family protein [Clostridia bacterium]
MSKSGKRSGSIIVRLIVLFAASYMVITLIGLYRELSDSQDKLTELKTTLENEQIQIEEYKALLSEGSHADIIEKAARERLGFVYSNEEVYVDISGN